MYSHSSLRSHLVEQLAGQNAHVGLDKAVAGLKTKETGIIPTGCTHSIWMQVEHIRIAQHDILDFSRNPDYTPLSWPEDYWPRESSPQSKDQWEQTLAAITTDLDEMVDLVKEEENDLLEPIPHGDGQTLLREAMLIVDHNAYHIGQIVQLRKIMGNW